MRDVFYTLMVVWIIWKIVSGLNRIQTPRGRSQDYSSTKTGETKISYSPPGSQRKKNPDDGEYVDFEEIK